jgi:hypothetical protein
MVKVSYINLEIKRKGEIFTATGSNPSIKSYVHTTPALWNWTAQVPSLQVHFKASAWNTWRNDFNKPLQIVQACPRSLRTSRRHRGQPWIEK